MKKSKLLLIVIALVGLSLVALQAVLAAPAESDPNLTGTPASSVPNRPASAMTFAPTITDPNWAASAITFTPAVYDPLRSGQLVTTTIATVNSSGEDQPAIIVECEFTGGDVWTIDPPPELVTDHGVGWARDFAVNETLAFTVTAHPVDRHEMPVACTIDSYMTGAHHDFTRTLPVVTPPASVYLPLVAGGNSAYIDPNWGASTITFTPAVYDPQASVITATIKVVNSSGAPQPAILVGCNFAGGTLLAVDPPPDLVSTDQGVGWVRDFAIDETRVFTATLEPNGQEDVIVACALDNFARHIHYEFGRTLPVARR